MTRYGIEAEIPEVTPSPAVGSSEKKARFTSFWDDALSQVFQEKGLNDPDVPEAMDVEQGYVSTKEQIELNRLIEYKKALREEYGVSSTEYREAKRLISAPSWYRGGAISDYQTKPSAKPKSLSSLIEKAHKSEGGKSKMAYKKKKGKSTKKTASKKSTTKKTVSVGAPSVNISQSKGRNASKVQEHVRGMIYPHANTKPRIMDGAVAESQTRYVRNIHEINISANQTAMLIISPAAVCVYSYVPSVALPVVSTLFPEVEDLAIDTTAISATTGQMQKGGVVDRWRVVGMGTKLSLLNTSDENDGWFESFRVTSEPAVNEIVVKDSATIAGSASIIPKSTYFSRIYNERNASQSRTSYTADALKNIDKYYFRLNPYAEEHPFIDVNKVYYIESTGIYSAGPPKAWTPDGNDTHSYRPLINGFIDQTWDSLCVIMHAGSAGSNILLDGALNYEVVYDNASSLARFHQSTVVHNSAHKATHKVLASQAKAGISVEVK